MPLDQLEVNGARELHALARRLREQGAVGLTRELRQKLHGADKPLEAAIRFGVTEYVPNRYGRILRKALRLRTSVKSLPKQISVRMVLTAKGKARLRQIGPLNNPGTLRHPIFADGPRRLWRWTAQRVRAGFFSDPVEMMRHDLRKRVADAMHAVGRAITKG